MLRSRWNLRTQIAVFTVAAIYLGIAGYLKLPLDLILPLMASPVLLLTIVYERKLPQWLSLVIGFICVAILFTCLLPDIH